MFSLLTRELLVQRVYRLLQELHLHLVLLLNVAVLNDNLLVVLFDVAFELGKHTHLQLLIVVNVLCNPVDGIFESPNITLILADL